MVDLYREIYFEQNVKYFDDAQSDIERGRNVEERVMDVCDALRCV